MLIRCQYNTFYLKSYLSKEELSMSCKYLREVNKNTDLDTILKVHWVCTIPEGQKMSSSLVLCFLKIFEKCSVYMNAYLKNVFENPGITCKSILIFKDGHVTDGEPLT